VLRSLDEGDEWHQITLASHHKVAAEPKTVALTSGDLHARKDKSRDRTKLGGTPGPRDEHGAVAVPGVW
jgi:hypothetical protein